MLVRNWIQEPFIHFAEQHDGRSNEKAIQDKYYYNYELLSTAHTARMNRNKLLGRDQKRIFVSEVNRHFGRTEMENDDGKNAIKIMCSMRTKPFMRVRNGFYAESRRMWPLNER